jgi:hypothetical protein
MDVVCSCERIDGDPHPAFTAAESHDSQQEKFMSNPLGFIIQPQQQTQWCWSAVSTSVDHFYNGVSTVTQCQLANDQLGQNTCCNDGSTAACNKPWYLDKTLKWVSRLKSFTAGSMSFADSQAEVDGGAPLCLRIGWSGGGGHFVVIYGYIAVGAFQYVIVGDPFYGVQLIPHTTLQSTYQGTGSWTHSYKTN